MADYVAVPPGFTSEEWASECAAAEALNWDTPIGPMKWPEPPPGHLVYFVGGRDGPVKIGFTQQSMRRRLPCIQNGSPVKLYVLATLPAPQAKEAWYHRQFAAHRLFGEWFTRCPEIEAEIERLNTAQGVRPNG